MPQRQLADGLGRIPEGLAHILRSEVGMLADDLADRHPEASAWQVVLNADLVIPGSLSAAGRGSGVAASARYGLAHARSRCLVVDAFDLAAVDAEFAGDGPLAVTLRRR